MFNIYNVLTNLKQNSSVFVLLCVVPLFSISQPAYAQISEWKITASDEVEGDRFGGSVSISGDYAVVGAWGDDNSGSESGIAYIYKRNGTSWTDWTDWITLEDSGVSFRYHCKIKPYEGEYKTYFEFMRSDSKFARIGDRKYAHVRIEINGYSKPIRMSFTGDSKRVWHSIPFFICNSNINYTWRVEYSKYSNQPREWSE